MLLDTLDHYTNLSTQYALILASEGQSISILRGESEVRGIVLQAAM